MGIELVDTLLFVDIIQNSGATESSNFSHDNINTAVYIGRNNRVVVVDLSEEYIDAQTGSHLLCKLGLSDLVDLVFPNFIKSLDVRRGSD